MITSTVFESKSFLLALSREKLSDLLQWSDHFLVQRILARIQDVPFYSEQAILYSKVLLKLVLFIFNFYLTFSLVKASSMTERILISNLLLILACGKLVEIL